MAKLFGANYELKELEAKDIYPEGLHIDAAVQRELGQARVKAIGNYVIKAVDTQTVGAFFAPIVVNKRQDGNMYILDGQHRYKGIGAAIDELEKRIKKLSSVLSRKNLSDDERESALNELTATKRMLNTVRSSKIPVMVYLGLNQEEERQLFHDLNNLAKRAPTSLALLFDNSDPHVRIAKEVISIVDGLEDLVDSKNQNKLDEGKLFLFSTIHKSVVKLLGKKAFSMKSVAFVDAYNSSIDKTARFFEIVLNSLPPDKFDSKYLYKDAKVLQGIAEFVRQMDSIQYVDGLTTLRELLKEFSFDNKNKLFATAGGASRSTDGTIIFKGTGTGISAVVKTLTSQAIRYDSQGAEVTDSYKVVIDETTIDDSEVETPGETSAINASASATVEETLKDDVPVKITTENTESTEEQGSVADDEIAKFFS